MCGVDESCVCVKVRVVCDCLKLLKLVVEIDGVCGLLCDVYCVYVMVCCDVLWNFVCLYCVVVLLLCCCCLYC